MSDFGDVQVFTGQELAEQKKEAGSLNQALAAPPTTATADQARAIAEVHSAMVVARMNPRSEVSAYNRIIQSCKRRSLADVALYAYKRGGQLVTGPSIRIAEVIARSWGNMTYGLRELTRSAGESEVEAFAWDLETNTRVTRQFVVRHIRDKSDGNVALTGERDIYELVANMGQRRVRACILELIPGDIVDAAIDECRKTQEKGDGMPMEDRIRSMVVAFGDWGVTQEMLETYLGHKIEATIGPELVRLKQIYRSIIDGMSTREEFFAFRSAPTGELTPEPEKKSKSKPKKDPDPKPGPEPEPTPGPTDQTEYLTCPKDDGAQAPMLYCMDKCPDGKDCAALAEHVDSGKE